MINKTKITYWLQLPGEDSGMETELLSTFTSKVPESGEVINIETKFDLEWAEQRFKSLSTHDKQIFFPKLDKQVKGDFVVVTVKRFLEVRYHPAPISKVFAGIGSTFNSTSVSMMEDREIPVGEEYETFEVFVQPFKHSELTETPIAKLRNLLGPMFGTFDLLNLVKEHPDKEKELRDMFFKNLETANETMPKIRELIGNDKNWK